MGIKSGAYTFKLSKPIKYKFDNGTHEATEVVLQEPGMEHIKFYLRLRSMLTKSQLELAGKAGQLQEAIGEEVKPIWRSTSRA